MNETRGILSAWGEALVNSVAGPMFVVDREYRIVLFNRAHAEFVRRVTGLELVPGLSALETARDAEDRVHLRALLDRALAGESVSLVSLSPAGSHSSAGYAASFAPVFEGDQVVGVVASVVVPDRAGHDVEAALRAEAILESATDAIVTLTTEGRIATWNPGAEHMYGYTADEAADLPIGALTPPASRAQAAEFLRGVVERNEPAEMESQRLTKEGHIVDVWWAVAPIRDEAGEVTGLSSVSRDITGRKAAEKEILEAYDVLEHVVGECGADLSQAEETVRKQATALRSMEEERALAQRAFAMLRAANVAVRAAADEQTLLTELCEVVTSTGYVMAWVGMKDEPPSKRVVPVAGSGHQLDMLMHMQVTWDEGPQGRGPSGRAIRSGKPVVARDLDLFEVGSAWRAIADDISRGVSDPQFVEAFEAHRFRSVVSLPLMDSSGEAIGVLSVYAAEPDAFEAVEVSVLEELATSLSFGLSVLRAGVVSSTPER